MIWFCCIGAPFVQKFSVWRAHFVSCHCFHPQYECKIRIRFQSDCVVWNSGFFAAVHQKTVLEDQTLKGDCFHGKHKQVTQKRFSHREPRSNGTSAFPDASQKNRAYRNVQRNIGDFGLLISIVTFSGSSVFVI